MERAPVLISNDHLVEVIAADEVVVAPVVEVKIGIRDESSCATIASQESVIETIQVSVQCNAGVIGC